MKSKQNQRGATMLEYAILLALLTGIILASLNTLGPRIRGTFFRIYFELNSSGESGGGGEGEGGG